MYMVFIDLKKAYDKVVRNVIVLLKINNHA
jgi:hypothetical protein